MHVSTERFLLINRYLFEELEVLLFASEYRYTSSAETTPTFLGKLVSQKVYFPKTKGSISTIKVSIDRKYLVSCYFLEKLLISLYHNLDGPNFQKSLKKQGNVTMFKLIPLHNHSFEIFHRGLNWQL